MQHGTLNALLFSPGEKKPSAAPIHDPSDDSVLSWVAIAVGTILVAIFVAGLLVFARKYWQNR